MSKRKPEKVCHSVVEASDLIKQLANPNRLALVCYLMEAPRTVTELEDDLGIPQPTLSQQLTQLREAGVISRQRQARSATYWINDARVLPLVQALRLVFAELKDIRMQDRGPMDGMTPGMPDMFD
ncbi:ArsR/SmtB family transcription factor [Amorphus orientalis]|uniref:DNA-binding transcriptional ArsR family regulator n=1 Tax=Amorphus orientalis TaxID=649198 RepID=A0AAE3VN13_9HYPH|nr:metalloregulator ArsR/SmtB family transcription factor [Amorphus orientalis]MDQ0314960.1 DNA-binding transcriptional ArsR family regulator [Amorphus orientalis]